MQVKKRDGRLVDFDGEKIKNAIIKAFKATNSEIPDDYEMGRLLSNIYSLFDPKDNILDIEDIQDIVEKVLAEGGYFEVAKAYVLYRESHKQIRKISEEVKKFSADLVSGGLGPVKADTTEFHDPQADLDVIKNQNASVGSGTVGAAILQESEAITKLFWESKYDPEIRALSQIDGGKGEIYIHDMGFAGGYCFTGDTRLWTLDGKHHTFKELVDSKVEKVWVFAVDPKTGNIVPALAENPRITREVTEICNVTLSSGETITCTPDHPFMLRDGSFVKAKDIKANTSLMPLYVGESAKYCSISPAWYSGESKKKTYLHRWVAEEILGRSLENEEVVHHKDGDKHNNSPENLQVMKDSDHRAQELTATMQTEAWKKANNKRLVEYNKSEEKRHSISEYASSRKRDDNGRFTYVPGKDPEGLAYNHTVIKVATVKLYKPIKVYDITVPGYENFALSAGVFVHNCAGWSLKDLILKGIGGVPGKIASAPAKHLHTLCNQMVNFLGILQNEWAGAQAFSSFDTYLAPFVKADNLTYDQTKQCIQSFVFGVNTPSRWGCVPVTTNILTPEGWKSVDELKIGDTICTWVDGTLKEAPLKHIIKHKNDYGVLHQYKGANYIQTVTPEHRCIIESGTARGKFIIKQSMDIFGIRHDTRMPMCINEVCLKDVDDSLSDAEVMLAAMYYADGTDLTSANMEICKSPFRDTGVIKKVLDELGISYTVYNYNETSHTNLNRYHISEKHRDYIKTLVGDKYEINPLFMKLSQEQSELFIKTWAAFDGSAIGRISCQYDNEDIKSALEIIMLRAGYLSHTWSRKKPKDKRNTNYLYADKRVSVVISEEKEIAYDGDVWCPNTDDGTAIYKDADGNVFISGNCQAPFSNITLDWTVPADMKNLPAIVGGKEMDFTYGDCKKEMDMVNKAFIETMIEGDCEGRGFAYPIPTYSITSDFDWSDTENNRLLFEMAAKYGTPYFSNYINSDMDPSDVRSMCCRLRLDLRELRKQNGGNFGAGENTGSIGVVTINLPQIAFHAQTEEDFFKELTHAMDVAARSLDIKRKVLIPYLERENSAYPYTKAYLEAGYHNHFSTVGIVGMNEACLNANWLKKDLTDPECLAWAGKVLDFMREKLSDYQEKYGCLFNLEATPAESTCYTLARKDKEAYPNIITAGGNKAPYYTNSSHLPVGKISDIFEALEMEDDLQTKYTSGTVFHAFLGQRLPDWKAAAGLVKKIAENFSLPYFTLSPTYSICPDHGYIEGEQKVCPHCGKPTEIYSRITGYYRAVSNWNNGKASEFAERLTYDVQQPNGGECDACTMTADMPDEKIAAKAPEAHTDETEITILSTKTCPKCKMAKSALDAKGITYRSLFAEDNDGRALALKLNVMAVPVMIIRNGQEEKVMTDYSEILNYINGL